MYSFLKGPRSCVRQQSLLLLSWERQTEKRPSFSFIKSTTTSWWPCSLKTLHEIGTTHNSKPSTIDFFKWFLGTTCTELTFVSLFKEDGQISQSSNIYTTLTNHLNHFSRLQNIQLQRINSSSTPQMNVLLMLHYLWHIILKILKFKIRKY